MVSKHFLEVETGKVHIFLPFTNIFGIWRISVIILQGGSSQKIPGLKVLKKVASVGHKYRFSVIKKIFHFFIIFQNFSAQFLLWYLIKLDCDLSVGKYFVENIIGVYSTPQVWHAKLHRVSEPRGVLQNLLLHTSNN